MDTNFLGTLTIQELNSLRLKIEQRIEDEHHYCYNKGFNETKACKGTDAEPVNPYVEGTDEASWWKRGNISAKG